MKRHPRLWRYRPLVVTAAAALGAYHAAFGQPKPTLVASTPVVSIEHAADEDERADRMLAEGQRTFRFDTFGSEDFWGGSVKLHQAIEGERLGGVGPGLSPKKALGLGLKVDAAAVPKAMADLIKAGKANLDDPAVTLALLKANAVVGVTDREEYRGRMGGSPAC
jgi:hypothetical protein